MVLRYGARVGAIGALVGSAGSFASAKMLESWLFGLPPRQPVLVLGLAASFLLLVTAACYLPARRAMRIDPMHTLRTD